MSIQQHKYTTKYHSLFIAGFTARVHSSRGAGVQLLTQKPVLEQAVKSIVCWVLSSVKFVAFKPGNLFTIGASVGKGRIVVNFCEIFWRQCTEQVFTRNIEYEPIP